jgi:hypothetical protein
VNPVDAGGRARTAAATGAGQGPAPVRRDADATGAARRAGAAPARRGPIRSVTAAPAVALALPVALVLALAGCGAFRGPDASEQRHPVDIVDVYRDPQAPATLYVEVDDCTRDARVAAYEGPDQVSVTATGRTAEPPCDAARVEVSLDAPLGDRAVVASLDGHTFDVTVAPWLAPASTSPATATP